MAVDEVSSELEDALADLNRSVKNLEIWLARVKKHAGEETP